MTRSIRRVLVPTSVAVLAGLCICTGSNAFGETLGEAVMLAYQYHPTLRGQRAALSGLDEARVQARAGYGPTVSLQLRTQGDRLSREQQNFLGQRSRTETDAVTYSGDFSITQPLYTGGRVRAAINAADAQIFVGREDLRQTEARLLQQVIQAYVAVRADQDLLTLANRNVELLRGQLAEVNARFAARQVTRTDLAQAEGRLAGIEAAAVQARGRLSISRATYAALVGQPPGELEAEPMLPAGPATLTQALEVAEAGNAGLRAALYAARAAEARMEEAKASGRATASLRIDLSAGPVQPNEARFYENNARAAVVISRPLFTSGVNQSRVRQAVAETNRRSYSVDEARLETIRSVVQAWEQVETVAAAREGQIRQLHALTLALKGVERERQFGLRTVLDVLNAEQERQAAEGVLVQSRVDEYAAKTALLLATGLLEAEFVAAEFSSR